MTTRLSLLLLALTSLPFSANIAKAAEKGVMLRLLACEVTKEPAKVFLQTKGSKSEVFELSSSALSKPMAVSARSVELKSPDADVALCSITLPAEGKSFAVLLAPEESAGFVPFVVRLDDASFKAGDYYFVNRSANAVVLKLGAAEVVLEAGNAVKSRPTEPAGNNHYIITMSARSESGDKVFASTRWPVKTKSRSYIVFLTGSNGRTSYRAVDEFVEESGGGKKR
jgi:hypothetical protein